jgi:hypothetical protein
MTILTSGFSLVLNIALLKKILDQFTGLHYRQEYLCLSRENFKQTLQVHLLQQGQFIKDITNEHLFTGYSPLIITLFDQKELPGQVEIVFYAEKDAVARISLNLIRHQAADGVNIFHYEGQTGKHQFLNRFHQFIIQQKNRLYNKRKGNVYLHNNLYKQVQIAYSVPRMISLVTTGENKLYNLFPTDLHGPIGENYYVDSLRNEGKASEQVFNTGKMVISEVAADFYKTVYALGKNHMKDLRPRSEFPFSDRDSFHLNLPIPVSATNYRELSIIDSFVHGLHRIFLFRVIHKEEIKQGNSTLAHVHNLYATWLFKKGFKGNFLLR